MSKYAERYKPTIKIHCPDCPKIFNSSGRMFAHRKREHEQPERKVIERPPVQIVRRAPEPLKQTTVRAPFSLGERHTLLGGARVDVGDAIWIKSKFVVKEITKTAGSPDVSVILEKTKGEWSFHNPRCPLCHN